MEKEIYRNKLNDPEVEEIIMPIFDFFESFIDPITEFTENKEITHYYRMLNDQNIVDKVLNLRSKVNSNNYTVMKSFVSSLLQNILQFLSSSKFRTRVKWRKILSSYINVSRIFLEREKLQHILEKGTSSNQKLLLAISLVDIHNDKIKVNKEIQNICDLFCQNQDITVFPIHGCSTNIFKTLLDKFPKIDMLHLAGHTFLNSREEVLLSFSDSNMTFEKYSNLLSSSSSEFSFYNCCSSNEFITDYNRLSSQNIILHSGEVSSEIAYNFAENFYQMFENEQKIDVSWEFASENCEESPMNYIFL